MDYRRAWHKGGTYFLTVNCLQRKDNDCEAHERLALFDISPTRLTRY